MLQVLQEKKCEAIFSMNGYVWHCVCSHDCSQKKRVLNKRTAVGSNHVGAIQAYSVDIKLNQLETKHIETLL